MSLNRRDALRVLSQGAAGTATLAACGTAQASAKNRPIAPDSDAVGMLYDATICTGCKACVSACTSANGLVPDTVLSNGLWQMPQDLNAQTKNIIKLARGEDTAETSYVKRQCMHCLEPACVSGCPFGALMKRGTDGVVTSDLGYSWERINGFTLDPDGALIGAGSVGTGFDFSTFDAIAVRYLMNGTPDASFGNGGTVIMDHSGAGDGAYDATLQSDGKILVCGSADVSGRDQFALSRLLPTQSGARSGIRANRMLPTLAPISQ